MCSAINIRRDLKQMFEHGEIPQDKRADFADRLVEKEHLIREALSEPLKVLKERYYDQLRELNDAEINELHGGLSGDSFKDPPGRYYKSVYESAKRIKSRQLKNELLNLWREVAGNDSPREWSNAHRTPILVMVPQSEAEVATKIFETVMSPASDEKAVKDAIEYLQRRPSYFAALDDQKKIDENFREKIIGKFRVILNDAEVRDELKLRLSGDAYQWYPNVRLSDIVARLAKNKYYSGGAYDKVRARVMRISDEAAKKLLVELLEKNFEIGLKILMED